MNNNEKNKNILSDEDLDLWDSLSQDIEPINKDKQNAPSNNTKNAGANKQKKKRREINHLHSTHPPDDNKAELLHGETADIDKNTARKFKQGKMGVDARMDLHGMTQDQAHIALANFIINSYEQQKRSLLIITGKGKHGHQEHWTDSRIGVLKEMVPRWLNSPDLRHMILSFSYATQHDGGEGALYVLLKRKRKNS